jgi:FLVCR family feline leukemia virus subgroup C receptor-related protein
LAGVIAGLIGDICVGTAIKKTKSFKFVLRICNGLVTVLFGILIISIHVNKVFFFIMYFLVCGSSAIMALTFEFSCELCFPMSESTTIAMLGFFGNLINFFQAIPELLILKVLKIYFKRQIQN